MNVLLIAIDTLRADHLSCYGYPRDTSPHLDALAGEGVLLEQAFANGVPTMPSFTTLYTGQHPLTHQVVSHGGQALLHPDSPCLTRELQRGGFRTAAVDNLVSLRPWFAWGYDEYLDWSNRVSGRMYLNAEQVNELALPWLRRQGDRPFFLMVHYWDPHMVYNPPSRLRGRYYQGDPTADHFDSLLALRKSPLGELWSDLWLTPLARKLFDGREIRDAEYVVALYDACIRQADEATGALLAALAEAGLAEDTLVMVLGDHGEMLYRHGIFFDHHGLYDANLRIPCLVRWPGRLPAGRRESRQVHMMDVAPTLLQAAGLPQPSGMEGRSFLPALQGDESWPGAERLIAEECTWQAKWCLRRDGYKLILAREPDLYGRPPRELYDLAADPDEMHNLAADQPRLVRRLEDELEGWISDRLLALGRREDPLLEQGTSMGRKYLDRLQTYQRSWRARLVLRVKQLLYPLFGRWWQGRRWRQRYRQLELLPAAGAGSAVSTERD